MSAPRSKRKECSSKLRNKKATLLWRKMCLYPSREIISWCWEIIWLDQPKIWAFFFLFSIIQNDWQRPLGMECFVHIDAMQTGQQALQVQGASDSQLWSLSSGTSRSVTIPVFTLLLQKEGNRSTTSLSCGRTRNAEVFSFSKSISEKTERVSQDLRVCSAKTPTMSFMCNLKLAVHCRISLTWNTL